MQCDVHERARFLIDETRVAGIPAEDRECVCLWQCGHSMALSKKRSNKGVIRILPVWRITASRKDSRWTFLGSILNCAAGHDLSLHRKSVYDLACHCLPNAEDRQICLLKFGSTRIWFVFRKQFCVPTAKSLARALNGHCVACGSQALLSLSGVLGGTIESELSFAFATSTYVASDGARVCSMSAAA